MDGREIIRQDIVNQIMNLFEKNQLTYKQASIVIQQVDRELGKVCVVTKNHLSGN